MWESSPSGDPAGSWGWRGLWGGLWRSCSKVWREGIVHRIPTTADRVPVGVVRKVQETKWFWNEVRVESKSGFDCRIFWMLSTA